MPELRRDVITGAWTIIAPERARQPLRRAESPDDPAECPLCPGHESFAPAELAAVRSKGAWDPSAWQVRVFPNPRPALRVEGDLGREPRGIYDAMRGIGAHEIIVDSPTHTRRLASLGAEQLELVLQIAQKRMRDLAGDIRLHYAFLFKDQGTAAGMRLQHSCTQLLALPMVPAHVTDRLAGAERYYAFRERCPYCDIVLHEQATRERLILELPRAVATCPFAARRPFECWVLPRFHASRFELAPPEVLRDVAAAVVECARRLDIAVDSPDLHLAIHTAPMRSEPLPHFHWHVEVVPLLEPTQGPELATGLYINPTPPEESASSLRKVA